MRIFSVAVAAALLAGCISAQEIPLAPNVVRIDVMGTGRIGASMTSGEVMKRAAVATLARDKSPTGSNTDKFGGTCDAAPFLIS